MILTAQQPAYLPWIGLFHKISLADSFCYMDDVQYQVNDFNNRNKVKGPNGAFWLTVPIYRKNHLDLKIKEAKIVDNQPWQSKHWKSLLSCYSKAPFFSLYADFLEDVYQRDWTYLSDLNDHCMKFFLDMLDIKVEYHKMSNLNILTKKSDLVLDMCLKLNASTFIFGKLGRDYADTSKFEDSNIKVVFQDYYHPKYSQLFGEFESHLSIIDLLFNCGPNSMEILMSGNVTRNQMVAH